MEYDVALSFAGEDREYVEKVADVLHAVGLKVFYDKYEEVDMWGKNLYTHLDDVYRKKQDIVLCLSQKYYKEKLWTNHERQSVQARSYNQSEEYILPIKIDETEIPGLLPTTGYIKVSYLYSELPDYKISIAGTNDVFECQDEDYHGEFPLRLLLEMYRLNLLDEMFLLTGIVPN